MKKTNFVHGYKTGSGRYVEVLRNPLRRDLKTFDSGANRARAFLTPNGELLCWTPEELHTSVAYELNLCGKDVVPLELHLDEKVVYITDNLRDRFGGFAVPWDEKVAKAKALVEQHRATIEAVIDAFRVLAYGEDVETVLGWERK
jgi:hypothetical protein